MWTRAEGPSGAGVCLEGGLISTGLQRIGTEVLRSGQAIGEVEIVDVRNCRRDSLRGADREGDGFLDLTRLLRQVRIISMLPSVEGNNLSIREILSEGLPLYILLCE